MSGEGDDTDRELSRDPGEEMEGTRRHRRYEHEGAVSYRRLGPSTPGGVRNISEGGVMVELPELLPPGAAVDLDISLGDRSIHAEVEIVWSRNSTHGSYPHGCKFTRLELQDRLTLAVFLAKVYGG